MARPDGERPVSEDPSATTQLRLPGLRGATLGRLRRELPRYDYEHYSRLAGPLQPVAADEPYRVAYRSLLSQESHRVRAALMLGAAPVLSIVLLVWLLQPSHWTERDYPAYDFLPALDIVMLVSIALIEFFRCMNVVSNAHATLVARDPVPVVPESGTRVAFLTSFVPGKEPLEMVTRTLEAAVKIRHRGLMHVWLLDEGDDPEVKEVCRQLGVHHFTRKGIPEWNQEKGPHRAKTKHGNYNAWLQAHGDGYDYFASVDTDHVPMPNYLERMLGFFRDPDVGFVIGPQVYGNYDSFVTKAAESQQFLFHALIQRAGNRYGSPMFVGTSNAVRISALKQIGGLYDSITEDMATGFEMHRAKNPATGRKWKSVYTPDVLAVGEGPNAWTDFFTQQLRWSRGTYETILKQFWKAPFTLPPGRFFNYTMMVIFYPMSALNWILAALSCALFLGLGASGVNIDPAIWLMLYGNASALQIGLYIWNRRHNVSPHEPEGSGGIAGMVMSALSAPIYARSLLDAVLRRKSKFVVTPKGDSASPDTLTGTFRIHLFFILVFAASMAAAFVFGHAHPAMLVWASFALLVTAAPIFVWRWTMREERRAANRRPGGAVPAAAPAPVPVPAVATSTPQAPSVPQTPAAPQARSAPQAPAGSRSFEEAGAGRMSVFPAFVPAPRQPSAAGQPLGTFGPPESYPTPGQGQQPFGTAPDPGPYGTAQPPYDAAPGPGPYGSTPATPSPYATELPGSHGYGEHTTYEQAPAPYAEQTAYEQVDAPFGEHPTYEQLASAHGEHPTYEQAPAPYGEHPTYEQVPQAGGEHATFEQVPSPYGEHATYEQVPAPYDSGAPYTTGAEATLHVPLPDDFASDDRSH